MEMIAQDATEIFVVATGEGGRDGAGIAARFDGKSPIDLVRQDASRFCCLHLEAGNEENKAQARIDREFLMPIGPGDDETPELGRSGVVRMTFELGTEPENLGARQGAIEQRIQGVEHTEPNRDAAPEATGAWHIALDFAGKCKRLALRRPKEFPGRLLRHPARHNRLRRRDGDEVVQAQGDAETIKPRTEIRSGGRDACRDLLLFQKKSPENADWRAMRGVDSTAARSRSKTMAEKPMKDWIDFGLVRDFATEKTEAYRLCTKPGGWVERYGADVIVSYKTEAAREEILHELDQWSELANEKFERVFGRYLPKQNSERNPPSSFPAMRERRSSEPCSSARFVTRSISAPAIPRDSSLINAKIGSSSGARPRAGCSIVLPTPALSPSSRAWPAPKP